MSGKINRKILLYILFISSLLTLLLTAYKLYEDYQQDLSVLDAGMDLVVEHAEPILAKALWDIDDHTVALLLDSLVQMPYISYITVKDSEGVILYSVGHDKKNKLRKKIALHYVNPNTQKEIALGSMHMYPDFSPIQAELTKRFFVALYTQFFQTFLVSLFILALLHHLVSRHLLIITDFLRIHKNENMQSDLMPQKLIQLPREKSDDELQLLLDTLNQYRRMIFEHFSTIRSKQQQLESEIKERIEVEQHLFLQNTLVNALFDALDSIIVVVDAEMRVLRLNSAAEESLRKCESECVGTKIDELIHLKFMKEDSSLGLDLSKLIDLDRERFYRGYCQFGESIEIMTVKVRVCPLYAQGKLMASALIFKDERDQKRLDEIAYNAAHDYLTGVYNRYCFDEKINNLTTGSHQAGVVYSVGLLDLDSFKFINDLFGHSKGDEVLINVAGVMTEFLGESALIARQGGDEFIFVVAVALEEAESLVRRMLTAIEALKFIHGSEEFQISGSIGLALLDPEIDPAVAIGKADEGCYVIKEQGGGGVHVVLDHDSDRSRNQQVSDYKLIGKVRKLIDNQGILLFAQKLVPLQMESDFPVREEILSRFAPIGIHASPEQVVLALERGRITHMLDNYVMDRLSRHIEMGESTVLHLNVNLSPLSLYNHKTQQSALRLLDAVQKMGGSLYFEITEHVLIRYLERVQEAIRPLREHGALIAVDDFGKGFASYSYIETLDADMIKIDGSLVSRISESEKIRAVISSIQSIANSIDAVTVAEHVETEEDKAVLRKMGVDYTQSFLDSVPEHLLE